MLNWTGIELARLRREELLREAAAVRLLGGSPRRGLGGRLMEAILAAHRRLHELEAARGREVSA